MQSLNDRILQNLLNERNLALAKKSIFEQSGEEVPKHFVDRLNAVEAAIEIHKEMMLEDAIKSAKNNTEES